MKQLIVILLCLIVNSASAHDIALAIYEISKEKNTLKITIKIDKEDLENIVAIQKTSINKYLKNNMEWEINNKNKSLKIKEIQLEGELYHVECILKRIPKNIQNIQVKNTILIDTVEKHSNVLNFNLNDTERTFRLHKERVETFFEY